MLEETADELVGGKGDGLAAPGREPNRVAVEGLQPVVRDGHPVRVAAEVAVMESCT